jgi:hypothetical protein
MAAALPETNSAQLPSRPRLGLESLGFFLQRFLSSTLEALHPSAALTALLLVHRSTDPN